MNIVKGFIDNFFRKVRREYTLNDVFGCPEAPPQACPTFIERAVHKQFVHAVGSYNIIVVYGESRQ